MKPSSSGLFRWLFVGFAVVVTLFGAATVVAERMDATLEASLFARSRSAVPRMQAMAAAREAVRNVEVSLFELIVHSGAHDDSEGERQAALDARRLMNAAVPALLDAPLIVDQRSLCDRTREHLAALDDDVGETLARVATDRTAAGALMDQRVHPSVERLREDFAAFVTTNVYAAQALSSQEHASRVAMMRLTYSLDAIALAIALVVALVVGARLRRYVEREEVHERVLELRASELENFAGRVAHDILSPLTAVSLAIQATRRTPERDPAELLARAERAIARVKALVDGLLEFARSAATPDLRRTCRVRKVIDEIVDDARSRTQGISFKVDAPPACAVRCAPGVLSSIAVNLVDNAVKYTAGRPVALVRVRAIERVESVVIEVEDTGPGVKPGEEEMIFLPHARCLATSDVPGIGLGLATVKRLVEAHGGRVGVRSRFGHGLVAWVSLPRAVEAAREPTSVGNVVQHP